MCPLACEHIETGPCFTRRALEGTGCDARAKREAAARQEGQPPFSIAILSDLSPWWLENTQGGIETPLFDG